MAVQPPGLVSTKTIQQKIRRKPVPGPQPKLTRGNRIKRRVRRCFRGWWTWELVSATVSVVAMGLLIVVLATQDKRQQRTWAVGHTQLTLNTIIAAIGTVIRASLLIAVAGALNQHAWNWFASTNDGTLARGQPLDDLETLSGAAADSWSCLKLLWRTRCLRLVSIGAFVTVLSIGFDGFVQQLLTVNSKLESAPLPTANLSVTSTLPRALSMNVIRNGTDNYENDRAFLQWRNLFTSAILNANNTVPGADCSGVQCAWPVTPTLGICSECVEVNAEKKVNSNSTCNSTVYTVSSMNDLLNPAVEMSTCGSSLRSSWRLVTSQLRTAGDPVYNNGGFPGERNTTLGHVYSFGQHSNASNLGSLTPFFAYRCTFFICVRGYSASSSLGTFTQRPVSAIGDRSQLEPPIDAFNSGWWTFEDLPPELNAGSNDTFRVLEDIRSTLAYILETLFNAGEDQGSTEDGTAATANESDPVAQILWEASDSLDSLNSLAQEVSEVWTSYIRTKSLSTEIDPRFAPQVTQSTLVVGVRWVWLTYPLALVLGGVIFLAATMYTTSSYNVRPWKGRRVPLLLAQLDESVQMQAQGGLSHRTGLDDCVGAIRVRLDFDGDNAIAFRRIHGVPVSV